MPLIALKQDQFIVSKTEKIKCEEIVAFWARNGETKGKQCCGEAER